MILKGKLMINHFKCKAGILNILHNNSKWVETVLHVNHSELSQKTMFQSVPIAALCLYNIQRENLVFKNSLCMKLFIICFHQWAGEKGVGN